MYRNREMDNLLETMRKIPLKKTEKVEEQLPRHHSASQTMKPQEKPDIDAEDQHLEDYSEEDLEKAKDKGKETGHTLTEPKEDELKVEPKKESKKGKQLYLCNECFKTFRANESVCAHCKSKNVEKIVLQEGKDEPGERDGTGPAEGSYQRKKYGNKGKRKQAGEKCPYEEGKVPDDKDSEQKKIDKLHETVQELIGEVPGIDKIDQHLLNKAIENGVIPNQFPELDVMIDELSAANVAKDLGVKDIDDVDLGDIDAVYLKYVLLPKAKEASRVAKESKLKEGLESHVDSILEDAGIIKGQEYEWENGLVVYDEKDVIPIMNAIAKSGEFGPVYYEKGKIEFTPMKGMFSESKLKEAVYGRDYRVGDEITDQGRIGNVVATSSDKKSVKVHFQDTDKEEWIDLEESKLKEQEKDSFKTLAKGIEDKDTADSLAKEKEGQVVADEDDEKKFAVITKVKEGKQELQTRKRKLEQEMKKKEREHKARMDDLGQKIDSVNQLLKKEKD